MFDIYQIFHQGTSGLPGLPGSCWTYWTSKQDFHDFQQDFLDFILKVTLEKIEPRAVLFQFAPLTAGNSNQICNIISNYIYI